MVPYSKEFRRKVLAACDAGAGTRAAALRFDVSESWVRRMKQERRETGKTAPQLTRRRTPKWAPYRSEIERLIAAHPDMTLQELQGALGAPLSVTTLCVALRQLKLTFKKKS
jgi:transposase